MKRMIFEPEHEVFRESVGRFFRAEIAPHSQKWREQGYVDREAFRKVGTQGYLLLWAPEAYGGAGIVDYRYEQIVHEENIRHGDLGFYANLHSMIIAPYIARFGTAEQKLRFLPDAVRGEKILAVAMTESGAGSDLAGIKTHAQYVSGASGGHWLLNGTKTYISNGIQADVILVAARTGSARSALGLFLIEAGMQGFERGRKLKKMGLHSQDTAELFFDNVRIPAANLLGHPQKGFHYLAEGLAVERLQVAIASVTAAQVAFDLSLEFVRGRRAFGKPIGAFQNTRFKMADLRTQIDVVQCFVDQCVMLANREELSAEVASEAKLAATELEGRVTDECLQLHGGAGYMEEYRICRMYQDARVTRIFAGTSEIMKEVIGRGLGLDERKLN
jgi:alkylation response protein AidB-like acyl-CoA dehydrogenase